MIAVMTRLTASLKLRFDGGRSLDFMLCDSGNIRVLRITGHTATCPHCGGCFSEHHRCFGVLLTVGVGALRVVGWLSSRQHWALFSGAPSQRGAFRVGYIRGWSTEPLRM